MAGDVEEPFRSFQADALHSGSISFGRFEAESLCWERRSSFSHNRYLEEVEKCSRPGSVIEKAAILEAHFKQKGLLSHSSSECQSATDYQTSENDVAEDMGYREESGHINKGGHAKQYKNTWNKAHTEQDGHVNEGGHSKQYKNRMNMTCTEEFEYLNENSDSRQAHESPNCSEYDGECEVSECEGEDLEVLHAKPKVEPILSGVDMVGCISEHVKPEEARGFETGNLPSIILELKKEASQSTKDPNSGVSKMDYKSEVIHHSSNSLSAEMVDNLKHQQEASSEVMTAPSSKTGQHRLKAQISITQTRRNISREASKDSMKKNVTRQRDISKSDKRISQSATPTVHLMQQASKHEDSNSSKAKACPESRSIEKELKAREVAESLPTTSEQIVSGVRRNANSTKLSVTKLDVKQNAATFTFKSDERAARRKEFKIKLEEKMHAKEAEMNQIQAKTLEKTEAEIKRLRKSLNFKATPMPSFYHAAVPGSGRSKDVPVKSRNLRCKSLSTGIGATDKSPSCSKVGNEQVLSAKEPVYLSDPPEASGATDCPSTVYSDSSASSPALATNRSHTPKGKKNDVIIGIKEQEKEMGTDLRNHGVSDGNKVMKGQRVEGKLRVGTGRNGNNLVKSDTKRVTVGRGSGMGRLAIGVTS